MGFVAQCHDATSSRRTRPDGGAAAASGLLASAVCRASSLDARASMKSQNSAVALSVSSPSSAPAKTT